MYRYADGPPTSPPWSPEDVNIFVLFFWAHRSASNVHGHYKPSLLHGARGEGPPLSSWKEIVRNQNVAAPFTAATPMAATSIGSSPKFSSVRPNRGSVQTLISGEKPRSTPVASGGKNQNRRVGTEKRKMGIGSSLQDHKLQCIHNHKNKKGLATW